MTHLCADVGYCSGFVSLAASVFIFVLMLDQLLELKLVAKGLH